MNKSSLKRCLLPLHRENKYGLESTIQKDKLLLCPTHRYLQMSYLSRQLQGALKPYRDSTH